LKTHPIPQSPERDALQPVPIRVIVSGFSLAAPVPTPGWLLSISQHKE
jgi:uncharacterized protein YcnI